MGNQKNPTNSSGARLLEVLDRSLGFWPSESLRVDRQEQPGDLHKVRL